MLPPSFLLRWEWDLLDSERSQVKPFQICILFKSRTLFEGGAETKSSEIERSTVGFTTKENRVSLSFNISRIILRMFPSNCHLTGSLASLKRLARRWRRGLRRKPRQLHSSDHTSASGNAFSEWFVSSFFMAHFSLK